MSLQKIKSVKNITYTDRYSKNTLINGLIKSKLETEMSSIKKSVMNIIKKQQSNPLQTKVQKPVRRNKSFSITTKSIKQAIKYDPTQRMYKATEQFVSNRQNTSFMISSKQLQKVNQARQQSLGLSTKLNQADILKYQAPTEQNIHHISQMAEKSTIKQYSHNVWIMSKPEVTCMIQDRIQQIKQSNDNIIMKQQQLYHSIVGKNAKLNGKQQNKMFSQFPLISYSQPEVQLRPANYVHQKYHKKDYKLIENWLQAALQLIATEKYCLKDKLNLTYSSYICVWKQIIRLTYIQSQEKGLTVEKMFYSMLRLFCGLLSQQQSLSKINQKQIIQNNQLTLKMMENRMEELNKRHITHMAQIKKLQEINLKLSKIFICYQKVNHQLVEEVEKLTKQKKWFQQEFYNVGNNFYKALQVLYDKNLIQMQLTQQQATDKNQNSSYKTFLFLDKLSKPYVLGRFKNQINKKVVFKNENSELMSQEAIKYDARYGNNLKKIQNQISRFWQIKQNDMEIKSIIKSVIIQAKIQDACYGTPTVQKQDLSFQFPQNSEDYVQILLKQAKQEYQMILKTQKQKYVQQLQQKQTVNLKWKQCTEQEQQKNKLLNENLMKSKQHAKNLKQNINEVQKTLKELLKQKQQLLEINKKLQQNIQFEKSCKLISDQNEKKAYRQRDKAKSELQNEKQNNKYLVRSSLQSKQKAQKSEIKHLKLYQSVKNCSPWLQKFMRQVQLPKDEINNQLLKQISNKVQLYLSDFVTKDSSLFMTRLL